MHLLFLEVDSIDCPLARPQHRQLSLLSIISQTLSKAGTRTLSEVGDTCKHPLDLFAPSVSVSSVLHPTATQDKTRFKTLLASRGCSHSVAHHHLDWQAHTFRPTYSSTVYPPPSITLESCTSPSQDSLSFPPPTASKADRRQELAWKSLSSLHLISGQQHEKQRPINKSTFFIAPPSLSPPLSLLPSPPCPSTPSSLSSQQTPTFLEL